MVMHSKIKLPMPNDGVRAVATPVAREPLLQQQDAAAPPQPHEAGDGQPLDAAGARVASSFPWLPAAGFAYLTFSSGMALHRCWPDRGDVAFVVSAYADLLLLFCCLRRYERAEPGSSLREWLKLAVWLLTSALTLLFSYKVAAVMPAAVAAVVWVTGLATICGGFLAFFCFQKKT
ncbi:uncharacterized protein [Miscanthus floridulus]|uniref:uncharacterized protein n=1 Tax=Miscanthus floridulus TaxID=154761 RepID=UPI00345AB1E6